MPYCSDFSHLSSVLQYNSKKNILWPKGAIGFALTYIRNSSFSICTLTILLKIWSFNSAERYRTKSSVLAGVLFFFKFMLRAGFSNITACMFLCLSEFSTNIFLNLYLNVSPYILQVHNLYYFSISISRTNVLGSKILN